MAHLDFERPLVELQARIRELQSLTATQSGAARSGATGVLDGALRGLQKGAERLQEKLYEGLTVWQRVQLSRHPDRPYFLDYLERLCDDFVELHGDRGFADDAAIVCGFARLDGQTVAVIGQQKGRTTKEKMHRNFAMAHPEGYRKAMRIMKLAERYRRPVLTFIDTPGAYPGVGAEERGQSEAIGQSLLTMIGLRVPSIAAVIGEGGSGGALALGVANRVVMMKHATYSVITPEGCASILWRDGAKAPQAAEQLKLLAPHAKELGVIDEIIDEPNGGAHLDVDGAARALKEALTRHLNALKTLSADEILEQRYAKFRGMGVFSEVRESDVREIRSA